MKKFYILLIVLFIGKLSYSQVFFENFQGGVIPSTFTLINDANTVNTAISTLFPDAWDVLAQFTDTANKVAASTSWFAAVAPADRWMITPSIILPVGSNLMLSWKCKSQDPAYLDGLIVKISTAGVAKTDFTVTAYNNTAEDTVWKTKYYSLQSLAGQSIHVAFVQQSTDKFYVFVDDIKVSNNTIGINEVAAENNYLNVYPTPAKDFVNIQAGCNVNLVKIVNMIGQVVYEKQYDAKNIKINTSNLQSGVYFLQMETAQGKVSKKFVIE